MEEYSSLWGFICKYLPFYESRNDVLRSDILFRALNKEEISDDDLTMIADEYGNNLNLIKQECIKLDLEFLMESLEQFYTQLIKDKWSFEQSL